MSIDEGYETRDVSLDISIAFNKVWHEGHLHKLEEKDIIGKLVNTVKDFLYQQKQIVVLNRQ